MLQRCCMRQAVLLPKQQQHRTPVIVCRHDLRKSANNAEERKLTRPKSIEERMMEPSLLLKAKTSIGQYTCACFAVHMCLLCGGCMIFNASILACHPLQNYFPEFTAAVVPHSTAVQQNPCCYCTASCSFPVCIIPLWRHQRSALQTALPVSLH
jgi:hypothetical protein